MKASLICRNIKKFTIQVLSDDKHIHKKKNIKITKIKEIMYIHILNLLCNVIPLWPKRKLKSAVIFIFF